MLFLLNDKVVEITSPEARLQSRWRKIGCGDPASLTPTDAIIFAKSVVLAFFDDNEVIPDDVRMDLAALIIAKTGANCLILKPTASSDLQPRLLELPRLVLETYLRGAEKSSRPTETVSREA